MLKDKMKIKSWTIKRKPTFRLQGTLVRSIAYLSSGKNATIRQCDAAFKVLQGKKNCQELYS